MMENFEKRDLWDNHKAESKFEQLSSNTSIDDFHIKLWIGTIKSLKKHPTRENAAVFGRKTITHVDILGTVIYHRSYDTADIYVCKK